jgi:hypothetical protein
MIIDEQIGKLISSSLEMLIDINKCRLIIKNSKLKKCVQFMNTKYIIII